jgi:hypothetical protein
MGRYEESAEVLERVRGEFLRSGSGAEVARVSLEAALAYVSSRRLPRAVELLGEGLAYFGSTRLDQEAAAAYLALRDALAMGRISGSALAASVMTLLERRAKHN